MEKLLCMKEEIQQEILEKRVAMIQEYDGLWYCIEPFRPVNDKRKQIQITGPEKPPDREKILQLFLL